MTYFNTLAKSSIGALILGLMTIPASSAPVGLPGPTVPESCGINIHWSDAPDPAEGAEFFDAGFGAARTGIVWSNIEKVKGVYDFSKADRMIDALTTHGVRPLWVLAFDNPLYNPPGTASKRKKGMHGAPVNAEGREAYARFAAAAAKHYAGRGVIWEIWNEPNYDRFWYPAPDPDEYAQLAVPTARAIREADPTAMIIGPGTSGVPIPYMKRTFAGGLLGDVDAVSFHPYRHYVPETAASDYLALRKAIAQCTPAGSPVRPIICSEWGYSTTSKWGISDVTQGDYVAREWLSNLAQGIDLTIYYDFRDDGTDPNDQEHHFGMVHSDLTVKPAYDVAKSVIGALRGYRFVHRLASASADDWRLLFANGDKLAVARWNSDPKAPASEQNPTIDAVPANAPSYAGLRRASSVQYASAPLIARGDRPALLAVAVSNPDSAPAQVSITADGQIRKLRIDPGQTASGSFALAGPGVGASDAARYPVAVTWNGQALPAFAPVAAAHVDIADVAVDPALGGVDVHVNSWADPIDGSLVVTSGGKRTATPISLPAFSQKDVVVSADTLSETSVSVLAPGGRVLAAAPAFRYVPMAGFPTAPAADSGFKVVAFHNNVPDDGAPAAAVATMPGDPSPVAVAMPYRTSMQSLFTELKSDRPLTIPAGARAVVYWLKADASGVSTSARLVDATSQTLQPHVANLEWNGWRAVRIPLTGTFDSWGGANDGQAHAPLAWDSVFLVGGSPHPEGASTVLIAGACYEMP